MQARTRKPHRGHCASSAIRGSGRSPGRNGCPGEVGFWSGTSGGRRKHNKPVQRHTGGKGTKGNSEDTARDSAACLTLQASPRRSDGDPRKTRLFQPEMENLGHRGLAMADAEVRVGVGGEAYTGYREPCSSTNLAG